MLHPPCFLLPSCPHFRRGSLRPLSASAGRTQNASYLAHQRHSPSPFSGLEKEGGTQQPQQKHRGAEWRARVAGAPVGDSQAQCSPLLHPSIFLLKPKEGQRVGRGRALPVPESNHLKSGCPKLSRHLAQWVTAAPKAWRNSLPRSTAGGKQTMASGPPNG